MYLVRLQGEKQKQTNKNPSMIHTQGGESFRFRQPPEEGMLFAVLLKDSSLYHKTGKQAALKKKKLRLYLGLIGPVDTQPI